MAEMLQRKPLFMGSNTAQMLRLVVQFTGKPLEEDLTFVTNKKVQLYVPIVDIMWMQYRYLACHV